MFALTIRQGLGWRLPIQVIAYSSIAGNEQRNPQAQQLRCRRNPKQKFLALGRTFC